MVRTRAIPAGGLVFLLMMAQAVFLAAPAAGEDVYEVRNVAVDESAASEVEAKAAGLAKAKTVALGQLLKRLTLGADHGRLPGLDGAELESAIRDTSIAQEKFTRGDGRYLARMNIRFRADAVRSLLKARGIAYAETRSKPLVMLPVYGRAGTKILWQDGNRWLDAWGRLPLDPDSLVPITMPLGDISDIAVISAQQATSGDVSSLRRIARKYEAVGSVVMELRVLPNPATDTLVAEVNARVNGPGWQSEPITAIYGSQPGQDEDSFLPQVAAVMASRLEEQWKERNLLDVSEGAQVLTVYAPLGGLRDWMQLRRSLADVPGVGQMLLESLTVKEAQLSLEFFGSSEQLQTALAQIDLDLHFSSERGAWEISRAGR